MKYFIVYWCIISYMNKPCSHGRQVDEFGVTPRITMGCAVLHLTRMEDCEHEKLFSSRDSAFAFYDRAIAKQRKFGGIETHIDKVKIDSISQRYERND